MPKTGKGGGRPPAGRRPLAPARRWLALTWRLVCCPALPVSPPPEAAPGPTCLPAVPAVPSSAFRPWPPARRPGPTPVPPERPPCTAPHAHATATLASRVTRGSSRVSSQRGPSRDPPSARRSTRPSRRLPRSRASPAPLAARRARLDGTRALYSQTSLLQPRRPNTPRPSALGGRAGPARLGLGGETPWEDRVRLLRPQVRGSASPRLPILVNAPPPRRRKPGGMLGPSPQPGVRSAPPRSTPPAPLPG